MKDWRSVVILVLVSLILGREPARTDQQPPVSVETVPIDLKSVVQVRVIAPVPVTIVSPTDNRPIPGPSPTPLPELSPRDTPLSKVGRNYINNIQSFLPDIWTDIADHIDDNTITDKSSAVTYHNTLSKKLNEELDKVFAAGIDSKGKIVNKSAITGQLRQSADALKK